MIRLRGVSHRFGERLVLDRLDLDLGERRIGVAGANGSGKSTFARLLNGLLLPGAGEVTVDGVDTRKDARAVRRRVGFVFQNPDNQIVYPVVEEDLAFGLKKLKLPAEEKERRIAHVLARYGLEGLRKQPSHTLSGGEKQLLAIAGVLIMEPDYLVLDEPTTLLDLRNRNRVAEILRALPQRIVTVSHDLALLSDYERVLVFDRGRVVADGAPGAALAEYARLMGS